MQSKLEQEPATSEYSTVLAAVVNAAISLGITEEQLSAQLKEQLHKTDTNTGTSSQISEKRMSNPQAGP